MRQIIENIGADIDSVSVDSREVRDRLMDDEKYSIRQIPTVLVLYSSGFHKKYTNTELDQWFEELLQNIQDYQNQQQQSLEAQTMITPLETSPPVMVDENVPKPLRRRSQTPVDIPARLAAPGVAREIASEVPVGEPGESPIEGAQAAMIRENIRQAEPPTPVTGEPMVQLSRKEIKDKGGLSAKDLARQMEEQREQIDDTIEKNRPFM